MRCCKCADGILHRFVVRVFKHFHLPLEKRDFRQQFLDRGLLLAKRLLQALNAFPHVSESEAVDWIRRGAPFVVIPGNLYRAVALSAIVTRDAASSTLVGATSLSLFIGNKRARKPLIAPYRLMT